MAELIGNDRQVNNSLSETLAFLFATLPGMEIRSDIRKPISIPLAHSPSYDPPIPPIRNCKICKPGFRFIGSDRNIRIRCGDSVFSCYIGQIEFIENRRYEFRFPKFVERGFLQAVRSAINLRDLIGQLQTILQVIAGIEPDGSAIGQQQGIERVPEIMIPPTRNDVESHGQPYRAHNHCRVQALIVTGPAFRFRIEFIRLPAGIPKYGIDAEQQLFFDIPAKY